MQITSLKWRTVIFFSACGGRDGAGLSLDQDESREKVEIFENQKCERYDATCAQVRKAYDVIS